MENQTKEEKLFGFLDAMRSGHFHRFHYVKRWSCYSTLQEENLASHSYYVSIFSLFIARSFGLSPDLEKEVVFYALFHDFDEIFTGDISHETKQYVPKLKEALDTYLYDKMEELNEVTAGTLTDIFRMNNLNTPKKRIAKIIVKIADWISFLFFIMTEKELGSRVLDRVWERCLEQPVILAESFYKELARNPEYGCFMEIQQSQRFLTQFIKDLNEIKQIQEWPQVRTI